MHRAVIIALAVLVLGPSGVRASTWYRSDDGGVRASCCCPARAGHHGRSAPVRAVRSACCCTILELAARDGEVRGTPPVVAGVSPVALPAVTPVPPAPLATVGLDRPRMMRGPPDPSDLFVRHCALLL